MNYFFFISVVFLFIFVVGRWLEKVKVPWVFAALILGVCLSIINPFGEITTSGRFESWAEMGMFMLLFLIGMEVSVKKIRKRAGEIFFASLVIIASEAVMGSAFLKLVFGLEWVVAFLVAFSFATVGEAVLVPILDEFGVINTTWGQTIIGLGTLDDLVELIVLVAVVALVDLQGEQNVLGVMVPMLLLGGLTWGLMRFERMKQSEKFLVTPMETLFFLVMAIFFLFVGIGKWSDAGSLGAVMAGVAVRNLIPHNRLKLIEAELRAVCYGLFAPIFFLWVSLSLDLGLLASNFGYIVLVLLLSAGLKLLGVFVSPLKGFNWREKLMLGMGLSIRFSTSIIIVKMLLDNKLITENLYLVLIMSSVLFTLILPLGLSNLMTRWKKYLH